MVLLCPKRCKGESSCSNILKIKQLSADGKLRQMLNLATVIACCIFLHSVTCDIAFSKKIPCLKKWESEFPTGGKWTFQSNKECLLDGLANRGKTLDTDLAKQSSSNTQSHPTLNVIAIFTLCHHNHNFQEMCMLFCFSELLDRDWLRTQTVSWFGVWWSKLH